MSAIVGITPVGGVPGMIGIPAGTGAGAGAAIGLLNGIGVLTATSGRLFSSVSIAMLPLASAQATQRPNYSCCILQPALTPGIRIRVHVFGNHSHRLELSTNIRSI